MPMAKGSQGGMGEVFSVTAVPHQPTTSPEKKPANRPQTQLKARKTAVHPLQRFVTFVTWKGYSSRVKLLPDTSSCLGKIGCLLPRTNGRRQLTINITGVIVRLVPRLEGWFQWPQCGEQPTI
jgi:hypothetical protein